MGSRIDLKLSIGELSSLIDLIEMAQDYGIQLTESQEEVYKYLQSAEAEELI